MTYRRVEITKLEVTKPTLGNSCTCKVCDRTFYIKKTSSNYSRKVCDGCKKV